MVYVDRQWHDEQIVRDCLRADGVIGRSPRMDTTNEQCVSGVSPLFSRPSSVSISKGSNPAAGACDDNY